MTTEAEYRELAEQLRSKNCCNTANCRCDQSADAIEVLLAEMAALNEKLPCGHRKVDHDDSYGGCTFCGYKNGLLREEVENEALRKDAERYRWLRGDACTDHSARWMQWEVRQWRAPRWTCDLNRDALDGAIDKAMEEKL